MSSTPQPVDAPARIVQIPSLLTNSYRAIIAAFGENIIQLNAHGSVTTTNQSVIDELAEYGIIREQETKHRLTIDYTQLQNPDGTGVSNPLEKSARESILGHVNAILDGESHTVNPDLGVTSVTIRITDDRLREVTPARTEEFDLYFEAAPAEEGIREQTRRVNADRGLYTDLGFNVTNLNLHSVIETATKYTEQSDGRYLSWNGPEKDTRPRVNQQLAVRINDRLLPDQYGTLKQYHVVDDEVLELATSDIEESDTNDQPAESEVES